MSRRKSKNGRRTNSKIVLDLDTAQEVVDLITDEPGQADEDLLDDALVALRDADDRVAPESQQLAGRGEAVAMELSPTAKQAVEALIRTDERIDGRQLRSVGDRLKHKLAKARERRRK